MSDSAAQAASSQPPKNRRQRSRSPRVRPKNRGDLVKKGGLPVGRLGMPYGCYGSVLTAGTARSFQLLLDGLEDALYGLRSVSGEKSGGGWAAVHQARDAFLLERQLLAAHQLLVDAPVYTVAVEVAALSELQGNPTGEDDQKLQQQLQARLHRRDREILVYRSVRMMRDLQTHTGKLFEIMVRNVDVVLPGGNGLQIPVLQPDGSTLYAPNHRTSETLTVEEGKSKYHAKLDKFLGQGGELTEMFELTKTSFAELSSGSMVEYVELVDGTVRVTPGDAGHLLLAEGQPVRAAGQLMVLREQSVTEQSESKLAVSEVDPISATTATTVTAMYVSNGSGTYKPDLYAAWRLSDRLANSYQVGAERVIVCKGMPAHCQTYKILLKSMGKTNAQVAEKVSSLLATAAEMCQPAELLLWEKEAARKLTVDRPEKEVAKRLARMQKQAANAALQQTATTPGLKQSQ